MEEMTCSICEADFRPQGMDGDKCKRCAVQYPKANSRKDISNPNKNISGETLTENRVKVLIYGAMEEAGFTRSDCEKCKSKFFKKSPSQKQCIKCRETK